jgi:hypothetical protein
MIDAEQIQHKIMSIYCDYKAQKKTQIRIWWRMQLENQTNNMIISDT